MLDDEYDIGIIGSGFAGCSAAIYAGMANLKCAIVAGDLPGGLINTTEFVDNYLAIPNKRGSELSEDMLKHAGRYATIIYSNAVAILKDENLRIIMMSNKKKIKCKKIIVCAGAFPRKLQHLKNNVSYCAVCDGFLYKGKTVAIIGGGNSAFEAALYLNNLCKKIYLVHRRESFRAFPSLINQVFNLQKVTIVTDEVSVKYEDDILQLTRQSLKVDGVFVCVGYLPNTSFLPKEIRLDKMGYVIVNSQLETTMSGVYAAGDIVHQKHNQGIIAASQGATAALNAIEQLKLMI